MFDKLPSVEKKSKAAKAWCENVSEISDENWEYVKIKQNIFEENMGQKLSKLISICQN